MPAPSPTARQAPQGLPLRDGFATMITFGADPDVSLWEKGTTPFGLDIGDKIAQSTFHNTTFQTFWMRALVEVTDGSMTVAYDPNVESQIMALIGVNGEITVTFNDGSTKAVWGCLKSFVPQEHSDGEQPEAQVEFFATNLDGSFAEQGPAIASVSGT